MPSSVLNCCGHLTHNLKRYVRVPIGRFLFLLLSCVRCLILERNSQVINCEFKQLQKRSMADLGCLAMQDSFWCIKQWENWQYWHQVGASELPYLSLGKMSSVMKVVARHATIEFEEHLMPLCCRRLWWCNLSFFFCIRQNSFLLQSYSKTEQVWEIESLPRALHKH